MKITLTLEKQEKRESLTFEYSRMVNAGYVGRDQEEVRRHIGELAKKGIPGPKTTPTLYPVIPRTLVTDDEIEVYGEETSGEIEYVLLVENEESIYVGLGSDHSDRHLEETDIPRCKQICPNVISKVVWPLAELKDRWDQLEIQSKIIKDGQEILYQQGSLALILDPKALMEFVRSKIPAPLDRTVIFSGTLSTLTGGFIFGGQFLGQLVDPKLKRRLELSYDICPLNYMTVEQESFNMLVASIQMGVVEGDKSRAIDEAAEKVLEAADQVYCLRDGSIVAEGPAQDFLDKATLEKLYFGEA